jgi:hypothetical protein
VHFSDGGVGDEQQAPDGGLRGGHGRLDGSGRRGRSVAVQVSW